MIELYGKERTDEICYRMGAPFRNSTIQRNNTLKFTEKRKNNSKYENILPNQLGYWVKKGYSKEEAKQKVKERQSTFSLAMCIKKHGKEVGTKIWQKRQEKWQVTLNSKPQEEIDRINHLKNPVLIKKNESRIKYFKRLSKLGTALIYDVDDLISLIEERLKDHKWKYLTKGEFIKFLPFYGNSKITPDEVLSKMNYKFPSKNLVHKVGKFYQLKTKEGLLRSMLEIDFYFELKKRNIEFEVEKFYSSTNKKYKSDFYIKDVQLFIEIAGMTGEKKYDEKMKFKESTYDSLILKPNQTKLFFERIDTYGFKEIKNYIRGAV